MSELSCEHNFVFIRQDKRNIGYDRNPTWIVSDVFFCSKCLKYERKDVERQTPRHDSLTEFHTTKLV